MQLPYKVQGARNGSIELPLPDGRGTHTPQTVGARILRRLKHAAETSTPWRRVRVIKRGRWDEGRRGSGLLIGCQGPVEACLGSYHCRSWRRGNAVRLRDGEQYRPMGDAMFRNMKRVLRKSTFCWELPFCMWTQRSLPRCCARPRRRTVTELTACVFSRCFQQTNCKTNEFRSRRVVWAGGVAVLE